MYLLKKTPVEVTDEVTEFVSSVPDDIPVPQDRINSPLPGRLSVKEYGLTFIAGRSYLLFFAFVKSLLKECDLLTLGTS